MEIDSVDSVDSEDDFLGVDKGYKIQENSFPIEVIKITDGSREVLLQSTTRDVDYLIGLCRQILGEEEFMKFLRIKKGAENEPTKNYMG